jgi:hypothetical protein
LMMRAMPEKPATTSRFPCNSPNQYFGQFCLKGAA